MEGEKNALTLLAVGGSDSDSPLFQTRRRFVKRGLSVPGQRVLFLGTSPGFKCVGVNEVVVAPDFVFTVFGAAQPSIRLQLLLITD